MIIISKAVALLAFVASAQASPKHPASQPVLDRRANVGKWDSAYAKADASLSRLSLKEKVGIVTGIGWEKGPCVGNTSPAGAINFPRLCLQDGPLGIRFASSITAFTPSIHAASTWDVDLIRQRAVYLGAEAKGLGVNILLGPCAGALGKIPQGGRNWEGFGTDPYLAGICMAETTEGIQSQGVQATAKHFLLNEQELNRETMSSSADDRTLREVYLWPFVDAVHADVAAVMCSYNKIDGKWACESEEVMTDLLKKEVGFRGFVVSDWNAQHTGVGSANAGLDMTMPGTDFSGVNNVHWGPQLETAVNNGAVPESRVDDMVRRVLAGYYLMGQENGYPSINLGRNVQGNHKENVRSVATDGTVLLKNDGILPLDRPSTIAVVGSHAVANPDGINSCSDKGCNKGALGMGWGSGSVNYPYLVSPADGIRSRAQKDGTQVVVSASDNTGNVNAARNADVAIVVVTSDSGEGYINVEGNQGDKNHLDPWHNGNELVRAVAAVNDNVVVVVHSTGPIILETIVNTPGVRAVVWGGLPSQESGNALADVLYGDVNPNGKLVYTIAKRPADYGVEIVRGDDSFPEGLYVDYRHFDKNGIEPRYEFGFGLSYTTYQYSGISVSGSPTSGPARGTVVPGGPADLFDEVATVTATVTNTGSVAGKEVAQLYVTYPSSAPETPPVQLRGFDKISLNAGQAGRVTFKLRRRDLSYYDTGTKAWVVPRGDFTVKVGASSRILPLEAKLSVS